MNALRYSGVVAAVALAASCSASAPARLLGQGALPEGRFTVVADPPGSKATLLSGTLRRLLKQVWAIGTERFTAVLQALILHREQGAGAQLAAATGRPAVYCTSGAIELEAATAADLVRWIELALGRLVVDETALSGRYDFCCRSR